MVSGFQDFSPSFLFQSTTTTVQYSAQCTLNIDRPPGCWQTAFSSSTYNLPFASLTCCGFLPRPAIDASHPPPLSRWHYYCLFRPKVTMTHLPRQCQQSQRAGCGLGLRCLPRQEVGQPAINLPLPRRLSSVLRMPKRLKLPIPRTCLY